MKANRQVLQTIVSYYVKLLDEIFATLRNIPEDYESMLTNETSGGETYKDLLDKKTTEKLEVTITQGELLNQLEPALEQLDEQDPFQEILCTNDPDAPASAR